MKTLLVTVLAFMTASLSAADVWYVDDDNYGKSGMDGKTPETAFGSLQEANDSASVSARDVIKIMPGVYDQGDGLTHSENARKSRFVITKPLIFESVAGKAQTHIVGALSSAEKKFGEDGMRCVYVSSTAKGTRFHGITFRDGSTDTGSGGNYGADTGEGGGICVYGAASVSKDAEVFSNAYIVDCVVSNCFGNWNGGIRGGTAIRTLIKDCGGGSWGESAISAALWNCVIDGNINYYANSDRPAVGHRSLVVNCTFHGCAGSGTRGDTHVYNSVFTAGTGVYDINRVYGGQWYPVGSDSHSYGKDECKYSLFAPAMGDYRLLAGTVCVGGGKSSYLTDVINLPDWVEMKDYNGNPIDITKETCDAGAVQGAVTAQCGRIEFAAGTIVDGVHNRVGTYAYGDTFPCFRTVKSSAPEFFRYKLSGFYRDSQYRYAMYDGTMHICHPPFLTDHFALQEEKVTHRYWVDCDYASGDSDGSATKPFVTIQDAMDKVAENAVADNIVVTVAPGDYAGGVVFSNVMTRVVIPDRNVLLKSSEGAAVTRIVGKAASTTVSAAFPGCGSDAVRCVGVEYATMKCSPAIQGFTLADGHTDCVPNSENKLPDKGMHTGGGIFTLRSNHASFQALDCVLTNCVAIRSGASCCTLHTRCSFFDCRSYGGVLRMDFLTGCYIDPSCTLGAGAHSVSQGAVLGAQTRSVHCSVPRHGAGWLNTTDAEVAKSWKYSNAYEKGGAFNNNYYWGSVFEQFDDSVSAYGQAVAEMRFANPDENDWRIWTDSPAITAGVLPEPGTAQYGLWASNYAAYASSDLNGERIRVTDSIPMPGCFQNLVKGIHVDSEAEGIGVSDGSVGFNELSSGKSLTFTESGKGLRPCIGMLINGVTNLFEDVTSVTLTADDVNDAGGIIYVDGVYAPHWYVNAVDGSDSNSGFRPEKAKKTLAGIMSLEGIRAGDTVHAAAGIYCDGEMSVNANKTDNRCRVVVPAGVTLVGDEGAENTFIVGSPDETDAAIHGLGPCAVRCVKLKATDSAAARLKGFTLTYGHSNTNGSSYGAYWGGGVIGEDSPYRRACYVEDCVISNNVAYQGAGVMFVNAVRCRIVGNRAVGGGGAGYYASYYGCLVDGNRNGETSGQAACWCYYDIIGCTLGADNKNFNETLDNNAVHAAADKVNSRFFGNLVMGTCNTGDMTIPASNCVFAAGSGSIKVDKDSCFYKSATVPVEVDEELRPVIGANVAVDAAIPELLGEAGGDFDLTGMRRVLNGRRDIGALEADWRNIYTADIARNRRFTVVDVSSNVVESASGTVTVNPGQWLSAQWSGSEGQRTRRQVSFRVTGGVLTVTVNGEPLEFEASESVQTLTFVNSLALNELTFVCSDTACAELLSASRIMGTVLSIR